VQQERWTSPLYWEHRDGEWQEFTLAGDAPAELAAPVSHVSYYEADAYARWAGARLPTEPEWEVAAKPFAVDGTFVESERFHPAPAQANVAAAASAAAGAVNGTAPLQQLYGDVWQWTQSAYTAYPGYVPAAGAIGEYNGKWMADQWVLRGASCATPKSHARLTYRNFFPSDARWQFTGIRLAAGA
jgi:ergothioneine biosynthesis protein EgtB